MKELIKSLTSISKVLSALTAKVEKMAEAYEKEAVQAKPAKKKVAPEKKVAAKKKATPKEAEPTAETSKSGNMLDNIYELISSGGEGTKVAEIREKTGFTPSQVNNALYKLKQKGIIDSISRGVYVKKES